MHECISNIIKPFHLFQQIPFNKVFVAEGERQVLKERIKTNKGSGGEVLSLSLCSLCEKNCLIFQTANTVPSNQLLASC